MLRRHTSARALMTTGALAATALVLAACQSSVDTAAEPLVDDPFPELSAAAEEEGGTLNYYFIGGEASNRELFDAFTAQYPFVNLQVTGGDPLQLIEKVVTENNTGQPVADILQGGPLEDVIINIDNDFGSDYRPAGEADVPEQLLFDEGKFVVPDYFTFHITYNTNNVSADEVPTSVEDLTDPAWAGRFGVDLEQIDWFAGELAYYGEEEGMALMEDLAANDPVVFNGGEGHEQLASGSLDVIVNFGSAGIARYIDQGAPIAIADQDHVIAQPDMYIPIADGPNQNTTRLFLEWLFTEPAQEVLSQGARKTPVLEGVEPPLEGVCEGDCELFWETTENFGDFDQRVAAFQELFIP